MVSMNKSEKFNELTIYTLSLRDEAFIHQHVVDAYTAQNADASTKPMRIFFALAGLYLLIEKNYTGRQVQLAHQKMSSQTGNLATINLPATRGEVSIADVLNEQEGAKRILMIKKWCASVWNSYSSEHEKNCNGNG